MGREYGLKVGTSRVACRIEAIHRVIDASDLSSAEGSREVQRHQVAECTLTLARPVAFDTSVDTPATSRFVIVDEYEIAGGGIVRAALKDEQAWVRDKVLIRNYKWETGGVEPARRAERYSQRPTLLLITGPAETDRKRLGRELEAKLFGEGRHVYHIGMRNLLYGVDADIEQGIGNRAEHLRRLGEVTNLLLDAGLIVIATAADLSRDEIEIVRTTSGAERMYTAWIGEVEDASLPIDLLLSEDEAASDGQAQLKALLQNVGAIFRTW
jgi:bifunctional enzyme CysN/CysC